MASVLESLAESVAADVRARRAIEADRAKPRATARWVTLITVGVLAVLALTGTYITPYGTPLGQMILVLLLGAVCRHLGVDAPDGHREAAAAVHRGGRPSAGAGHDHRVCSWPWPAAPWSGSGSRCCCGGWRRPNPTWPTPCTGCRRSRPAAASRPYRVRLIAGSGSGVWALKTLPAAAWARTPTRELALLRIPLARFYGEKVLYAAGRAVPSHRCCPPCCYLLDLPLPVVVPVVATLGLATVMFWLPDSMSATTRRRRGPSSPARWAPTSTWSRWNGTAAAAPGRRWRWPPTVGDSWVFRRLGEELARSRWSGLPPWEALHTLADRARPARAGRPGRHHAAVRAGRRPGVQQPAGPQRRPARRRC